MAQVQTVAPSKDRILDTLGDTVSKLRLQLGESSESVREFSMPLREYLRSIHLQVVRFRTWNSAIERGLFAAARVSFSAPTS